MDEVNPGTLLNPILYETSVYNWKRYNSYTYDLMQCAVSTSSTNGVGCKFIPMAYMRDLVKMMSYYKMNVLQVHLNDNGFKQFFGHDWNKSPLC